jgi:hypothetical protein
MRQQPMIKNIYGAEWKIDLTLWHKSVWPNCLFVEIKSQNISGSCDSKIPYVVLSLKDLKRPTGLLMVGNGFCAGLIPWLEGQQTEHFLVWRNPVKMREYIQTARYAPLKSTPRLVTQAQAELGL